MRLLHEVDPIPVAQRVRGAEGPELRLDLALELGVELGRLEREAKAGIGVGCGVEARLGLS